MGGSGKGVSMMVQSLEAYAFNNRLEIIKTRESRMVEVEKIEVVQNQHGVRMNAKNQNIKPSSSGDSNEWKGRYVDIYA